MSKVIANFIKYLDNITPKQLEQDLIELGIEQCPEEEYIFDDLKHFSIFNCSYEIKKSQKLYPDINFSLNLQEGTMLGLLDNSLDEKDDFDLLGVAA